MTEALAMVAPIGADTDLTPPAPVSGNYTVIKAQWLDADGILQKVERFIPYLPGQSHFHALSAALKVLKKLHAGNTKNLRIRLHTHTES